MFWWLYTIIYCKIHFWKTHKWLFPLHVCRMVPKNFEIPTIEKNDVSVFQRTFERPSTTSRSKFIPFWNSKIPLLVSFPQMHHMYSATNVYIQDIHHQNSFQNNKEFYFEKIVEFLEVSGILSIRVDIFKVGSLIFAWDVRWRLIIFLR